MSTYKIGLDFGTHQTKICIEDSSDKRNKRYFFHRFIDLEGKEHWTFPSIVQVNKDKTLSYGFTRPDNAFLVSRNPEDAPKKPLEPVYKQYKQIPEIREPDQPKLFSQNKKSDNKGKTLVLNDFASLKTLLLENKESEQEERKRKKEEKTATLRYEKQMHAYIIDCRKREMELKKDKEEVDRFNDELRKNYENELKIYEDRYIEYMTPYPFIFKNFKQAIFSIGINWPYHDISPEMVAVWYLSFIFFDIEEEYGNQLVICMGTSSGRLNWDRNKQKATQIMLAVYDMVENVCQNDKEFFLSLTIDDLIEFTKISPFSQEEKDNNSIFVFPEAYANINPLAQQRRFGIGINAIIDIGGGTTDISIFSAYEDSKSGKTDDICVNIYDYISIPYGVNAVEQYGIKEHYKQVGKSIDLITSKLQNYARNIGVSSTESAVITNLRPAVFSGGGSLRRELCKVYGGFSDLIHISTDFLTDTSIDKIDEISNSIAMLNTALGLAKCPDNDSEIPLQSYDELFSKVKEAYNDKRREKYFNQHYEHGLSDV